MQDKDDCIETEKYCQKIKVIANAFYEKLADFQALETDFAIFSKPFSVCSKEVPLKYQMKLIELKCNSVLKDKFANVDIITFYQYIGSAYPRFKNLALKVMSNLHLRTTVLFDEFKQISISIATDGFTSQLIVKSGDCKNFGARYKLAYQCQTMSRFFESYCYE